MRLIIASSPGAFSDTLSVSASYALLYVAKSPVVQSEKEMQCRVRRLISMGAVESFSVW